jgi:HPt (histidine-containing phosphotransfer) domain-containing protein
MTADSAPRVWTLPEALQQLLNDGEEQFVAEILDIFKSQTEIRIGLMRDAAANGRLDEARRHAHTIKGGASQVGARRLTAVCLEIETAPGLSSAAAVALVAQAEWEFEEVRQLLSVLPAPMNPA